MEGASLVQRKLLSLLLSLIMVSVLATSSLANDCPSELNKCDGEVVEYQGKVIELTADLSVEQKLKDHYKSLYDTEKFWGNIKDIVILIAIIAI